jgi:hypothetical protein
MHAVPRGPHLCGVKTMARQGNSNWQVTQPTAAHHREWAAAMATAHLSGAIIEGMKAHRFIDRVVDATMWRLHLVVHVRVCRHARRAALVEQPGAHFGDAVARSLDEPRAHSKRGHEAHRCSTGIGAMK